MNKTKERYRIHFVAARTSFSVINLEPLNRAAEVRARLAVHCGNARTRNFKLFTPIPEEYI